jgi:hypothetical protein
MQESDNSPPCCEPPAQASKTGKIAAATDVMLAEYVELLQQVNQHADPEIQDTMLQQCVAMLTHTKRTLLATEVSQCSETRSQHPGLSSERRLDAMEASRLRKQPKAVAAAPAFHLPPSTARERTSFAWNGAKGSAEILDQLYGKDTANSVKSPASSTTATRAPLADISAVQRTLKNVHNRNQQKRTTICANTRLASMDTSLWRGIEFALVPLQMAETERYARLWAQITAIAAVADALGGPTSAATWEC